MEESKPQMTDINHLNSLTSRKHLILSLSSGSFKISTTWVSEYASSADSIQSWWEWGKWLWWMGVSLVGLNKLVLVAVAASHREQSWDQCYASSSWMMCLKLLPLILKENLSEQQTFRMEGLTRTEPPLSRVCCIGPVLYPPISQFLFYGRI